MAKKIKRFLIKNKDITTTVLGFLIGSATILQEQVATGTVTFKTLVTGIGTFALSYFIGKTKELLKELGGSDAKDNSDSASNTSN